MTVRDFMNYLIYIEHAAENLQFYMWFQDYSKRFHSAATTDTALAMEWTQDMHDEAVSKIRRDNVGKLRPVAAAAEIFKGSDFEKQPRELLPPKPMGNDRNDPFLTPPGTADSRTSTGDSSHGMPSTFAPSYKSQAADAFHAAGAKQPCKCPDPLPCTMDEFVSTSWLTRDARQSPFSRSVRRLTGSLQLTSWTELLAS